MRGRHEDPVAALLPVITSEHATAIVAQQIRQTLSAPRPAPAEGAAAAGHGTFRYADPYSARCPDCDNPAGAAAEARKLLRSARDFAREEWPPSGAVRLMS